MEIYNLDFKDITCKECGYQGKPVPSGKIDQIHGYALRCPECAKWWGWSGRKKDLLDASGKRVEASIWSAKRMNADHCQLCQRKSEKLGDLERLEVHHVEAIADGGQDSPSNIWVVCTACHKEIHHRRTYFNSHLEKFFKAYVAYQQMQDQNLAQRA